MTGRREGPRERREGPGGRGGGPRECSVRGPVRWLADLLVVASVVIAGAPLSAQAPSAAAIRGLVVDDATGSPLAGADIAVWLVDGPLASEPQGAAAPGEVVDRTISDSDGRFVVAGLAAGTYRLEISFIGRGTVRVSDLRIQDGTSDLHVGRLEMGTRPIDLHGIQVVADRPEVTFQADRNVYHVGEMTTSAGGSLADVLDDVPELELDLDGRIELEGNAPEIYLNGRPAPLDQESLAAFLEQFPADLIDRIEVIPNPSARYRAEGAGGIVNIVLHEDAELGLTGSLFANANTRGQGGSGGRVALQRGSVTLDGGAHVRHSSQRSSSFSLRQNLGIDPNTFLEQARESREGPLNAGLDLRAEYQPSENLLVFGRARLNGTDLESTSSTRVREWDQAGEPAPTSERLVRSDGDRRSSDLSLGFEYRVAGSREHEISGRIEGDRNLNDQLRIHSTFRPEEAFDDLVLEGELRDDRHQDRGNAGYRLDYARPLGEALQLEVGVSGHHREHDNVRAVEGAGLAGATPAGEGVPAQGFFHGQRFHSGYVTAAGRRGDVAVQGGLRLERTATTFRLPEGEAFGSRHVRIFPSLNARWQAGSAVQFRLSYSQRIRRPGPEALNPIDQSADPYTREVGNPDLAPQFTHSWRMDTRWSGSLGSISVTPTYQLTTDEWVDIRTVDRDGVATETAGNLGTTHRYGLGVTASLRAPDGWRGSLRAQGAREIRDGGPEEIALATGRSFSSWSLRGNLSRQLNPNLSLQSRVNYRPGRAVPQGRVSARVTTRVGARLRVLDRRGALTLNLQNPLESATSEFETRDASHIQFGESTRSRRAAVLSFSYAFGGEPRRR